MFFKFFKNNGSMFKKKISNNGKIKILSGIKSQLESHIKKFKNKILSKYELIFNYIIALISNINHPLKNIILDIINNILNIKKKNLKNIYKVITDIFICFIIYFTYQNLILFKSIMFYHFCIHLIIMFIFIKLILIQFLTLKYLLKYNGEEPLTLFHFDDLFLIYANLEQFLIKKFDVSELYNGGPNGDYLSERLKSPFYSVQCNIFLIVMFIKTYIMSSIYKVCLMVYHIFKVKKIYNLNYNIILFYGCMVLPVILIVILLELTIKYIKFILYLIWCLVDSEMDFIELLESLSNIFVSEMCLFIKYKFIFINNSISINLKISRVIQAGKNCFSKIEGHYALDVTHLCKPLFKNKAIIILTSQSKIEDKSISTLLLKHIQANATKKFQHCTLKYFNDIKYEKINALENRLLKSNVLNLDLKWDYYALCAIYNNYNNYSLSKEQEILFSKTFFKALDNPNILKNVYSGNDPKIIHSVATSISRTQQIIVEKGHYEFKNGIYSKSNNIIVLEDNMNKDWDDESF
jgi:hypothetical protein